MLAPRRASTRVACRFFPECVSFFPSTFWYHSSENVIPISFKYTAFVTNNIQNHSNHSTSTTTFDLIRNPTHYKTYKDNYLSSTQYHITHHLPSFTTNNIYNHPFHLLSFIIIHYHSLSFTIIHSLFTWTFTHYHSTHHLLIIHRHSLEQLFGVASIWPVDSPWKTDWKPWVSCASWCAAA